MWTVRCSEELTPLTTQLILRKVVVVDVIKNIIQHTESVVKLFRSTRHLKDLDVFAGFGNTLQKAEIDVNVLDGDLVLSSVESLVECQLVGCHGVGFLSRIPTPTSCFPIKNVDSSIWCS